MKAKGKKGGRFLLIAGPCVLEGEKEALKIGQTCRRLAEGFGWEFVFKASYDKANRTSVKGARGPGLERGLEMLRRVGDRLGVRVTTDVHGPEEAARAGQCIDILQIPAFLCRQTDLLLAAAGTGRPVNVKKGQFMSPEGVGAIAEKLRAGGCQEYWITERGTTFGYNNLVVDMRGLVWMREQGHRVIFDATHSVQRPGSLGSATGGDGRLAPALARAAVAVGVDGLFLETHPEPARSPSDGSNMVALRDLPRVLARINSIYEVA
ncbi:MAG: 3-deoxy-8-phosphooctulonate synthase [Verrucomicrobiia bacterium]